jgi:hypothetical protein
MHVREFVHGGSSPLNAQQDWGSRFGTQVPGAKICVAAEMMNLDES